MDTQVDKQIDKQSERNLCLCVCVHIYIHTYLCITGTHTHGVSVVYMRPCVCNRGACNYAVIAAFQSSLSAQLHRGPAVTDIETCMHMTETCSCFPCVYI